MRGEHSLGEQTLAEQIEVWMVQNQDHAVAVADVTLAVTVDAGGVLRLYPHLSEIASKQKSARPQDLYNPSGNDYILTTP